MRDSGFTAAPPIGRVGQLGRWLGPRLARAGGALPAGHDWELWHRACAGDARSATELVRRITPQAHGLALQLLRTPQDAQDVVQEAFLRLWGCRPSDARGARLSTFFNTIVINRCKTLLGQRREISTAGEALTDLADAYQQLTEATAPELPNVSSKQLQTAMGQLPPRQRMALAMWAYADAEVPDIARSLEIEVNAAHQLLFRAKAALKHLLEGAAP